MKKIILLSIMLLGSMISFSQTKFEAGRMKIGDDNYDILSDESLISMGTVNSKYANGYPGPRDKNAFPILPSDVHVSSDAVKRIVLEVLKNKLPQLRENKERIRVRGWFEQNGSLEQGGAVFIISKRTANKGTFITPQEIHEIHERIKREIRATFTGQDYKNYVIIQHSFPAIIF